MVLVSDDPGGQGGGALGVITLEDVIEELIGEVVIIRLCINIILLSYLISQNSGNY